MLPKRKIQKDPRKTQKDPKRPKKTGKTRRRPIKELERTRKERTGVRKWTVDDMKKKFCSFTGSTRSSVCSEDRLKTGWRPAEDRLKTGQSYSKTDLRPRQTRSTPGRIVQYFSEVTHCYTSWYKMATNTKSWPMSDMALQKCVCVCVCVCTCVCVCVCTCVLLLYLVKH